MEKRHDFRRLEDEESADLSQEDFQDLLKQLSKKNKAKYQFILKAGNLYHQILYILFEKVWTSESKPDKWKKTVCHQLFKGKGEEKEFINQ